MGLRIYTPAPDQPPPRPVWLELACDGAHGLLPRPAAIFRGEHYPQNRSAAVAAGWRISC